MVRPVCPIWKRCGRQPASTAAREAPTAAPITLASDSRMTKFSGPLRPRPPETTISASASSGRPVADSSRRSTRLMAAPGRVTAAFSTLAVAPAWVSAGRNTLGRRVASHGVFAQITFESSLPAYTGRVATSLPSSTASAMESAEMPAPSLAAIRRKVRVLREHDALGAPLRELRQARLARLVGQPHRLGLPADLRSEPSCLAQHLGHHLLRIALPVVLDQAPERASHVGHLSRLEVLDRRDSRAGHVAAGVCRVLDG